MAKSKPKQIRFAALIRVSTEKQAQKGESLRTQDAQLKQAVAGLGGQIVATYAGQEHGTVGFEREQLDKLLADVQKKRKPFDAVIVADATRWSRDNVASETGLEVLRDNGVHFYVLTTEHDLYSAEARLFLGLVSTIGAYHARSQKHKSLLNRIERAKRGIPTGGKVPFGRTFDKETGKWAVDPDKLAMVRDVAERYLAGEQLPKLAKEYNVNHANLCKVLRERLGEKWVLEFRADDLNIHETVTLKVPRLLPERTIRAVRQRLEANRTYLHGKPKYEYLLAGRVFCAECGYGMFGQTNHGKISYYRHAHTERARECSLRPRPWVRADAIESVVVRDLFNMLGNPAEIERAVKAAIPDCDKLSKKRERLETGVAKIEKARNRVLDRIDRDLITDDQADKKLLELKEREAGLRAELDKISAADVPDAEMVRQAALHVEEVYGAILLVDDQGNRYAGGNDVQSFLLMTAADRQALVDAAFDSPLPDGRPAGVYVNPVGGDQHGPKRFRYVIRGLLIGAANGVTPRASS